MSSKKGTPCAKKHIEKQIIKILVSVVIVSNNHDLTTLVE